MLLRKVQQTGGGTFFVCVPKDWAQRNGLKRHSLVALSETADGRLIIDAKYGLEKAPKVGVIRLSPFLDREIVGKYLLGCDIIRVEAEGRMSPTDRERIKQVLSGPSSRLIGLEIVEEDYSKIVMQCLLEPSAFPPAKILQREHSIASSMHRDAVTALIEGDVHLARNVISRDTEVNRLYFLLVRILRTVIQNPRLSEKLGILPIDCFDYRLAASLVEAIGDQSVQIAESTVKLDNVKIVEELAQPLFRLHNVAFEAHENALRALYVRDIELAEAVRDEQKHVQGIVREVESLVHKRFVDIALQILVVSSCISRIYDHSLDIADLVMPKSA